MLIIESMDDDTEMRRLSPVALTGGDTGHGHYTDLINGPMDHGWFASRSQNLTLCAYARGMKVISSISHFLLLHKNHLN